ncbi:hypothetical protein ACFWUP_17340 [Nocardia sp. NPDC058658]|uniref:hypothetical protein n=1 Tax=Nocardia sp. NPDC058658 TaxID=3346580 RepID=UPI0036649C80
MITDPALVRELLTTAPMPPVPAASEPSVAWLRASVPRFCDGDDHARRRAAVCTELDRIDVADLSGNADGPLAHVRILLGAMELPPELAEAVAEVAAAYQPHAPVTPTADAAVRELVAACGGQADEATAARICVLVQACAATGELIAAARASNRTPEVIMATTPPLRSTRRVVDGVVTELDLRHPGLGFGAGPHRCPGSDHALALATAVLASADDPAPR